MPQSDFDYDIVIVGGGPAGLSAALLSGRSCRKVLVYDAGQPRNVTSPAVHGFFSRDGVSPSELLQIGRDQLKPYDVDFKNVEVIDAEKTDRGFRVLSHDGQSVTCRKLILATGLRDELPKIEGLAPLWGQSVLHCPYCHGWEVRHRPWAYLARGEAAVEWSTDLLGWTSNLTLCSNGPAGLSEAGRRLLTQRGVVIREEAIQQLESDDGQLKAIVFEAGDRLDISVLFARTTLSQRSDLPRKLGCKLEAVDEAFRDAVTTDPFGATSIEGLYVVGDASKGAPQVATAVSEGLMAAVMANKAMLREDLEQAKAGN